jgi:hypothetical protein
MAIQMIRPRNASTNSPAPSENPVTMSVNEAMAMGSPGSR